MQEKLRSDPSGHITPTQAAHEWNRLLREYGEVEFPVDAKNLVAVKRALSIVQPKTLSEFSAVIQRGMSWWTTNRSEMGKHKTQPAHPWVLNRYPIAYEEVVIVMVEEPATIETKTAPDTVTPHPPAKPKGKGMFELFNAPKKKYPPAIPTGED